MIGRNKMDAEFLAVIEELETFKVEADRERAEHGRWSADTKRRGIALRDRLLRVYALTPRGDA
jgi:hypothetical protein